MELIERYIHSVGQHLPRKNRADIQSELRSLLMDNLEARTQDAAREEDVVALLTEFGPPEKVAASYWPEGQYLIGPSLFPTFRMVVGIALAVMVGVQILVFGINLAIRNDPKAAMDLLGGLFGSLMSMLGTIVLVFYLLQLYNVRLNEAGKEWDPRSLPAVEERQEISRGETIAELVFGLIFLGLLLAFPGWGALTSSSGERIVISDPVLRAYLPWLAISLILGLGLDIINLWQGRWQLSTRLAKLGIDLFGTGVLTVLIDGHNTWLAERGVGGLLDFVRTLPQGIIPSAETVQILVMQAVRMGLVIAMVVTVVETIQSLYRLFRHFGGERVQATLFSSQGTKPGNG